MEFKFTVLDYQTRAADAVVRVFDGQPKIEAQSYLRDVGTSSVDKRARGVSASSTPPMAR